MSRLPKKKSRPITVDGRKFRWLMSGRNRYIGKAPVATTISIQEELEHPGQTLQCTAVSNELLEAPYQSEVERYGVCKTSIIPSDIEKIIRAGLARGWKPAEGHGTFHPGNVKLEQYTVTEKEPVHYTFG